MKSWRMIYWPDASPQDYIVTRPLVNDLRAKGQVPDTFLIYSVKRYFVAVGRHINIDDDINLQSCSRLGVKVFRKIGGGGSGIWGPNSFQLAMAFGQDLFPNLEESLKVMIGEILLGAVHRLGVAEAQYKHIGDIMVRGRKLGGFAALPHGDFCVNMGGFLNLEDLDINIASAVMKTPEEKFSDKAAKDIRDYATSLQREAGREISREALVKAIADELIKVLGAKVDFSGLSEIERDLYDNYQKQYTSEEWTFAKSDRQRFAQLPLNYRLALSRYKSRKLVCAHVLLDDRGKIAEVMLSGDYFIKPINGDDLLAESLIGLNAADFDSIKARIRQTAQSIGFEAIMMTVEDFATPVIEACGKALGHPGVGPQ